MTTKFLTIVCFVVLATILSLGLWPFHAPANEVGWIGTGPGLAFGKFSTAIAAASLKATAVARESGASAEIWMMPERIWDRSTFLAFSGFGDPYKLSLRQNQMDLEIRTSRDRRAGTARFFVKRVFRKATPLFVTLTSGAHGTTVYTGGRPAGAIPELQLSAEDFTGRLVAGDSPGQTDSWRGQMLGLAIYHRELAPVEVERHYLEWTQQGRPETGPDEGVAALYRFSERSGRVAHSSAGSGPDLLIPKRYTVVDQIFLEPFWREFSWSGSYWSAAETNIIGFIPVGFSFYALFTALRIKRAGLATVVLGTAVSATIELLQFFLPTRDSGTTDLFTNTLGTWIGVVGYRIAWPLLAGALPATLRDGHDGLRN